MSVCFVIKYRIIFIHTQQSQCIDPKQVVLFASNAIQNYLQFIYIQKLKVNGKQTWKSYFTTFYGEDMCYTLPCSLLEFISLLRYRCIFVSSLSCHYSAFWYYIVESQVRSIIWLTGFFTTTVMFPSGISISGTQFFASLVPMDLHASRSFFAGVCEKGIAWG